MPVPAPVGAQAFYAWGGGGQFAVMVPSLDLVVVTLYGGIESHWVPPPDIATYKGSEFFPLPTDVISKTRWGGRAVQTLLSTTGPGHALAPTPREHRGGCCSVVVLLLFGERDPWWVVPVACTDPRVLPTHPSVQWP